MYLWGQSEYPDAVEDYIGEDSFEDVSLSVDLPSIDLVEKGHHDKSIEDDCEVLGWPTRGRTETHLLQIGLPTAINIE